jgi:flagellar assembly protein FliH
MIIKKKNKKTELGIETNDIVEKQIDEAQSLEEKQEEEPEIDLFNLDNIDFKQRQERRRGDRRRGFRRIDDRNLISRAREEADAIKQAAAKEGYQEGLEAAKSDVESLKNAVRTFFEAKQQVYESIAPDILEIGFDIAKKIIKKESIENPEIILENIKDIMKGLSKEESKITLRVAPSQVAITKQKVPDVASSLGLEVKISVIPDESVMEGGCVLTTTNGVIDATIESQLEIISEVLKDI